MLFGETPDPVADLMDQVVRNKIGNVALDVPQDEQEGFWWMNIQSSDGRRLSINWQKDRGFGFYNDDLPPSNKPKKLIDTVEEAVERVVEILTM